ncbi:unnamed protein product [Paramecium sonneborni]|uniref:Uncharacterized protein n=1 Tax=Paramecium sonneborni TaxID=65129 RepID=A0A8S1PPR8_9CILI|nr:unnamed protein product [Paramecium sonneborni]
MKQIIFFIFLILICSCQQQDSESDLFITTQQIKLKKIGLGLMRNTEGIPQNLDNNNFNQNENDVIWSQDLNEIL